MPAPEYNQVGIPSFNTNFSGINWTGMAPAWDNAIKGLQLSIESNADADLYRAIAGASTYDELINALNSEEGRKAWNNTSKEAKRDVLGQKEAMSRIGYTRANTEHVNELTKTQNRLNEINDIIDANGDLVQQANQLTSRNQHGAFDKLMANALASGAFGSRAGGVINQYFNPDWMQIRGQDLKNSLIAQQIRNAKLHGAAIAQGMADKKRLATLSPLADSFLARRNEALSNGASPEDIRQLELKYKDEFNAFKQVFSPTQIQQLDAKAINYIPTKAQQDLTRFKANGSQAFEDVGVDPTDLYSMAQVLNDPIGARDPILKNVFENSNNKNIDKEHLPKNWNDAQEVEKWYENANETERKLMDDTLIKVQNLQYNYGKSPYIRNYLAGTLQQSVPSAVINQTAGTATSPSSSSSTNILTGNANSSVFPPNPGSLSDTQALYDQVTGDAKSEQAKQLKEFEDMQKTAEDNAVYANEALARQQENRTETYAKLAEDKWKDQVDDYRERLSKVGSNFYKDKDTSNWFGKNKDFQQDNALYEAMQRDYPELVRDIPTYKDRNGNVIRPDRKALVEAFKKVPSIKGKNALLAEAIDMGNKKEGQASFADRQLIKQAEDINNPLAAALLERNATKGKGNRSTLWEDTSPLREFATKALKSNPITGLFLNSGWGRQLTPKIEETASAVSDTIKHYLNTPEGEAMTPVLMASTAIGNPLLSIPTMATMAYQATRKPEQPPKEEMSVPELISNQALNNDFTNPETWQDTYQRGNQFFEEQKQNWNIGPYGTAATEVIDISSPENAKLSMEDAYAKVFKNFTTGTGSEKGHTQTGNSQYYINQAKKVQATVNCSPIEAMYAVKQAIDLPLMTPGDIIAPENKTADSNIFTRWLQAYRRNSQYLQAGTVDLTYAKEYAQWYKENKSDIINGYKQIERDQDNFNKAMLQTSSFNPSRFGITNKSRGLNRGMINSQIYNIMQHYVKKK